jgi:penicillin-binding protein 1C
MDDKSLFLKMIKRLGSSFSQIPLNPHHWKRWQRLTFYLSLPFLLFFLMDFCFPLRVNVAYTQTILAKDSTVLHAYLTKDQKWRLKTELSEIIPELKQALIYKEDKYFYYHFGLNPVAVVRAFFNNIFQLKTTSGASTITMQVARLLAPKSRNVGNKIWEAFRALQLEWYYSKDEILQLYLNLVPYGGNIEGVKSAALLYFDKNPAKLSLAQIVTLTIIPNRPTSLVLGKHNAFIKQERNRWLNRLLASKIFPEKNLRNALAEKLEAERLPAPEYAPQFCQRLRTENRDKAIIHSTLSLDNQQKVQQLTSDYVQRIQHLNISNASVLVINNRTKAVEVYVASANFSDKFNSGEVDGIRGVRSPGSTLKPLLYAVAMDKGLLTPKKVLQDVPVSFSGFEPENFYKQFTGNITAEQALIQSLNIPAVHLLETVGLPNFVDKLKKAQCRQVAKDEKKLGLSLILGGCGLTLEELTGIFATLANKGQYVSPHYLATEKTPSSTKIVSAEAAFAITEILAQAKRPDLPTNFENTLRMPKIAWKTGTSYGRRDAWSVGYNAHYTVGVWVGNFSGEGVNNLIGAEVATPLLFQVFNSLDYNAGDAWFKAPQKLQVRWVCSESGHTPAPTCVNQVIDTYIPLISERQVCTHQKEMYVSADEKTTYCLSCLSAKDFKKKLYPNLSPEMIAFYEVQGIAYTKIPPHNPACKRILSVDAPVILSPSAHKEYIIDRDAPPELALSCKAHNEVQKVYWYLNDQFYKTASPTEKVFFKPEIGLMKIACSDDKGGNSEITIKVSYE